MPKLYVVENIYCLFAQKLCDVLRQEVCSIHSCVFCRFVFRVMIVCVCVCVWLGVRLHAQGPNILASKPTTS